MVFWNIAKPNSSDRYTELNKIPLPFVLLSNVYTSVTLSFTCLLAVLYVQQRAHPALHAVHAQ